MIGKLTDAIIFLLLLWLVVFIYLVFGLDILFLSLLAYFTGAWLESMREENDSLVLP